MSGQDLWLGMDVGGTAMAAGLVTGDGRVVHARGQATHGPGGGDAVGRLLALAERVAGDARARGDRLVGAGAGVPGVVDATSGVVVGECHHVPELARVPLARLLAERVQAPTSVDNDVNAITLGEWRWGAGRGARSLVLLALGTGVGGGIVLDGRLVRGAGGYGGELGHVPVRFDGRDCVCGARGCLKAYVAGPDLGAEASRRLGRPADMATLLALAAAGDRVAAGVLDEATEALAAGLAIVVNGLNPERLLVAGSVGRAFASRQAEIRERLARRAYRGAVASTALVFVDLGKDTILRGGAALARHEQERLPPGPDESA